jgi:uncharacterized membrane protein YedE/YeeE
MDKETKKGYVGILGVIGSILFGFSIYLYFVDPTGWRLALATSVSFLVIGAVLISLAILIWKRY